MATTYRRAYDDSDDEIVWSLSDRNDPRLALASSPSSSDFIILSRPLSPIFHTDRSVPGRTIGRSQAPEPITATLNLSLTKQLANLRISGKAKDFAKRKAKTSQPADAQNGETHLASAKRRKKAKKAQRKADITTYPEDAYPSPEPSPRTQKVTPPAKAKKDQHYKLTVHQGNPIEDGNSDKQSVVLTQDQAATVPSLYEEASTFISRFLSNPEAKNNSVCRLTLLQSLIIELGLATSNLPSSLKSARAFLKARVFLNIREYIAVRSQGPDAIRKAMYPTKSALIKNFKTNKGTRAPLQWVKDMGLQVLLVGWMR